MIKVVKEFFGVKENKTFRKGDIVDSFNKEREDYLCNVAKVAERSEAKKVKEKVIIESDHIKREKSVSAKKGSSQVKGKSIRVTAGKKTTK